MSSLLLPQGTLDALDKRRRAFLWAGDDHVSGAQCLVAWELACQPKELGGLGIKDLAAQNKCLLLKLLYRLHNPGGSAWACWVRSKIDMISMHGDIAGAHWRDLEELLPMYRTVTVSKVENGETTSFWQDKWLSQGRLMNKFPLLYSHATTTEASVAEVHRNGIEPFLASRFSAGAREELAAVKAILEHLELTDADDQRFSPLSEMKTELKTGPIYRLTMLATGAPECTFAEFVWKNKAPPRVQFFGWLLVLQRLNCRANLKHKHILEEASCELCKSGDEDCDHLFLTCSFAAHAWSKLGMDTRGCSVQEVWKVPCLATISTKHYDRFLLLVCWNLWKHRNEWCSTASSPLRMRDSGVLAKLMLENGAIGGSQQTTQ